MKRKKKKLKIRIRIILFIIIFLIIGIGGYKGYKLLQNKTSPKVEKNESKENKPKIKTSNLSLIMVGDSLIHGAVYGNAKTNSGYDFKKMLTEIKNTTSSYDLAFYNQESILGGSEIGLSTYPRFNSPYEVGDAFIEAGFNLVSLANNHTLDRGLVAIQNSRNYWDKYPDIIAAGSYISQEQRDAVVVKEKQGIKYGLLSYTTLTNGLNRPSGQEYVVNVYDEELVKKDVESIRDKVDVLLVSMHWGTEYAHYIDDEQKTISEYLSELGVDIIIGHHSHVVQPIGYVGNTLVIYSLGNVISAQIGVERLTGLMAAVDIKKTESKDEKFISISSPKVELLYTCRSDSCNNGYKVYPYSKLNNSILYDYQSYYDKYMKIVKSELPEMENIEIK